MPVQPPLSTHSNAFWVCRIHLHNLDVLPPELLERLGLAASERDDQCRRLGRELLDKLEAESTVGASDGGDAGVIGHGRMINDWVMSLREKGQMGEREHKAAQVAAYMPIAK